MATLSLILCTLSPFLVLYWPTVAGAGQGRVPVPTAKADLWEWHDDSGLDCIGRHEGFLDGPTLPY